MADPLPASTPPATGEPLAYQPLSGLAIAGLVASCLFAAMVLLSALVALIQGAPFFFPPWMLLLAVAGFVLSLLALNEIKNSEGTRAGASLARAGVWLSLFSGLGYFAYYYVTGLALTSQANAFLMEEKEDSGFFPRLIKGAESSIDMNAAYLLALPPAQRGSVRAEDEQGMQKIHNLNTPDGNPGPLNIFKENFLVRMFNKGNAGQAQIEPLGVLDWKYENRSYQVLRNYRFSLPEATVETAIPVQSTEGDAAGQVRKWFIAVQQVGAPSRMTLTPLGEGLKSLRSQSKHVVTAWQRQLDEGKALVDFDKLDQTAWQKLPAPEATRSVARSRIQELFESSEKDRLALKLAFASDSGLGGWEIVDGRVRFGHPFRLTVRYSGDIPLQMEGKLFVETKNPVDPAQLTGEPEWVVKSLVVHRATVVTKKGPS